MVKKINIFVGVHRLGFPVEVCVKRKDLMDMQNNNIAKKIWHKMPMGVRHWISKNVLANARIPFSYFSVNREINAFMRTEEHGYPSGRIQIETLNRCNGKCEFCPASVHQPQRPYAKMDEALFKKLIAELHEIDYDKEIALFLYNEPFLDERIVDWYQYTREMLPKAYIYVITNGTVLTTQKLAAVYPYLDSISIDNYDYEVTSHIKDLMDWKESNDKQNKIRITPRQRSEVLRAFGGQSPNKKITKTLLSKCSLPYKMMAIRPDGKVSMCCGDPLGKMTLGDVSKSSISQVWNSAEYRRVREIMKEKGRSGIAICKYCDNRNYK